MANLLEHIEKYLEESGVTPTAFGVDCMKDPNFVSDVRQGRDYRKSTEDKVLNYISLNGAGKLNATRSG